MLPLHRRPKGLGGLCMLGGSIASICKGRRCITALFEALGLLLRDLTGERAGAGSLAFSVFLPVSLLPDLRKAVDSSSCSGPGVPHPCWQHDSALGPGLCGPQRHCSAVRSGCTHSVLIPSISEVETLLAYFTTFQATVEEAEQVLSLLPHVAFCPALAPHDLLSDTGKQVASN